MKSIRLYAAGPLAAICTTGLFLVMQGLVGNDGDVTIDEEERPRFVDVIQVTDENPPERVKRIVTPPPEPELTPDPVEPVPMTPQTGPTGFGPHIPAIPTPRGGGLERPNLGQSDGDYMPLVVVQPQYPRSAQERGLEGYAVVELTVSQDGSVPAHSILIVDAEPQGVFDRAAKKAAAKFKYKPRIIDGVAQAVSGVRYRFSFNLAE